MVFVFGCVDASQSAGSANKRITGRDTNRKIRLDKFERFLVISDVSCSEGDVLSYLSPDTPDIVVLSTGI